MIHGFENSEMVIARYEPENLAARKLFDKLGFVRQEELFRDRHVAVLKFEFEDDDDEDDDSDDGEAAEAEADDDAALDAGDSRPDADDKEDD